jgi:transposase
MDRDQQVKRWSAKKKLEVVLRLLGGEPLDRVSREVGVEISRLEEWKREALLGMESGLRSRTEDSESRELDRAKRQLGELMMENELLKEGLRRRDPFVQTRSKS